MKAVLFDFGGTLDSDGLTWGDRFFPLYSEAGLARPREDFNKAFWWSDDHLPTRFKLAGLGLEETLDLQVHCVLEELAPDRMSLKPAISGRFLADCRAFFDRNRPVLARLQKKYRLGIVSNFYGNLEGILRAERLSEYFDVVVDSAAVGHTKPSKEIFEYALNALDAKPAEGLMVGDSVPRDMKGAEGLSMPHVLLHPTADACCGGAKVIRTLPELEGLLA